MSAKALCFPTQSSQTYFLFYGNSKRRVKRIRWDLATFPGKLLMGDLKGVNPWIWSAVHTHARWDNSLHYLFQFLTLTVTDTSTGPWAKLNAWSSLELLWGHLRLFFTLHQAVRSTFPANRQRDVRCHAVSQRRGMTAALSLCAWATNRSMRTRLDTERWKELWDVWKCGQGQAESSVKSLIRFLVVMHWFTPQKSIHTFAVM